MMQPDATMRVFVNTSSTYQTILGFGTGFTDSAGYVTSTLSPQLQETIMRTYFGADGVCAVYKCRPSRSQVCSTRSPACLSPAVISRRRRIRTMMSKAI